MAARYSIETTGDIALTAATARTIMNQISGANIVSRMVEFGVSFDGTSGTAEPVTVELCRSTQAGAGTFTSHTILQVGGGPARTVQSTAGRAYTVEPTVLTVLKRWLVHPQTGIVVQFPLGREPEKIGTALSALAIRCTAPANVNVQGYIEFEEG